MSGAPINNLQSVGRVHIRDGLSQTLRKLPALENNYFNVDEMRFDQMLTQMQRYASLVSITLQQENTSALSAVFVRDEIMVMAQILSINLQKLEFEFERKLKQHDQHYYQDYKNSWVLDESQSYASPLGLAKLLDDWLLLLSHAQTAAGDELYSLLESIVSGLGKDIYAPQSGLSLANNFTKLFSPRFMQLISKASIDIGKPAEVGAEQGMHSIRSVYASLLKSVEIAQKGAVRLLPISMQGKKHDPAAALCIVFVELYKKLQNQINNFTFNFVDFYFNKVLQMHARPLQPDSVFLVMQLNPNEKTVYLPKGSQFLAGIDMNSQNIIYTSDYSLELNDAVITSLYSLFFNGDVSNENKLELTNGGWLNTIATLSNAKKTERDKMLPHPFFGAPRGKHESTCAVAARIGFAIASHVLLMSEGKRSVSVSFQYANAEKNLDNHHDVLQAILKKLPNVMQGTPDEKVKFFAYFGNMFQLSITTATGWLDIAEYKPSCNLDDKSISVDCLRINFILSDECPAISAYSPEIHGENYAVAIPILRFVLKENHLQYPYSILKDFVLQEIVIDVKVDGCRNLILHNNIGQLSPLTPFLPFGPLPTVGSYFIVGHEEMLAKKLTDFNVEIEWGGLPVVTEGFKEWYKAYAEPADTEKFISAISVLADGKWLPGASKNSECIELFSVNVKDGQKSISTQKTLQCKSVMHYYKAQDPQTVNKQFVYTPATKSGLFKFTLQGPAGAFGHQENSQLLADVLTHNTRLAQTGVIKSIFNKSILKPLPKPPYTPQISSIKLNYSAGTTIIFTDMGGDTSQEYKDQFMHLQPLGWEKVSLRNYPKIFQLPQYDTASDDNIKNIKDIKNVPLAHKKNVRKKVLDSSLFIGFKSSNIASISLFFHLKNNSLPMTEKLSGSIFPQFKWFYLSDNQWRPIELKQILRDTTNGFMVSGVVNLDLPEDINQNNSIMPEDQYWLKISANEDLENFSYIYSVYAQAIQATWSSGLHPITNQPMVLPADTIQKMQKTVAGISSVIQICPSFGGVPAEIMSNFRTRAAERLRHKNRALTPLDYEMLILEKFPEVYKVKCFANVCKAQRQTFSPGHILIIPIVHLNGNNQKTYKQFFDGNLIVAIKEFIQKIAPVFSEISVENPTYEEIQVRCAIHFKKGCHAGHHQNLLNQALCDFLSPWSQIGNRVHFGWNINTQEILSFIQVQDYIEYVTDFSLLRIAKKNDFSINEDDFILQDTAAIPSIDKMQPLVPWSTAVPMANHYINVIHNNKFIAAEVTGYDELEIGSTFIIS